ncbi:unnamed protein product, partial [Ceratitis capitata]
RLKFCRFCKTVAITIDGQLQHNVKGSNCSDTRCFENEEEGRGKPCAAVVIRETKKTTAATATKTSTVATTAAEGS